MANTSQKALTAVPGSRAAHKTAEGCWKTGNTRLLFAVVLDIHELTNASELEHWVTPRSWILQLAEGTDTVGSSLPERRIGKTPGNVPKGIRNK